MKKALFLLCISSLFSVLSAQEYDISTYKARYNRRPLLEISPFFVYSNAFYNENRFGLKPNSFVNANLSANWSESSNTDKRIRTISSSFGMGWQHRPPTTSSILDKEKQSNLDLSTHLTQFNYITPKWFWGISAQVNASIFRIADVNSLVNGRNLVQIKPGLFAGIGRIEYAEDALLANWMVDDLLATGAIEQATVADRLALAQRITSIIGNRTFDFRRRRIYELAQLRQVFLEQNATIHDDFLLFAVLNDNWAFANRASLPNGEQVRIGLDLGMDYFTQKGRTSFGSRSYAQGRPYIEYTHARVLKNRAAGVWSATMALEHNERIAFDDSPGAIMYQDNFSSLSLSAAYNYIVLPSSRTRISLFNEAVFEYSNAERTALPSVPAKEVMVSSKLVADYFINNNLRAQLEAGFASNYGFDTELLNFNPYFSFRFNYAVF
ncbi:MAG: hypothetical protein R2795_01255 [Saprospiraceae bacterium]